MKKTITRTSFFFFAFGIAPFIPSMSIAANTGAEKSTSTGITTVSLPGDPSAARQVNPVNESQAIFDIQFNHAMGFPSGVSCVYTGTEFWIGAWNKDSIYTLDPLGNVTAGFTIAGVGAAASGVRAFAYDGTYIYAADNTTLIKKIDPASKTLLGTITAPSTVRGMAYDSTANSGAGGFWISNFNTSIVLVSMTGATLETITLGEHGVPSIYGIAFDPYTVGGPYIWAFGQGTSNPNDSAKLHRISIPTHLHTGVVHDVNSDVAIPGAIAGSVSITWRYDPMHYTLMGCTQDAVNTLFGYELADYTPPAVDANCNTIDFYPAFTQVPTFEISPLTWDVHITNNGTDPLNDVSTTFVLDDGTNPVYSPAAFQNFGVTPGSDVLASFGNFIPPAFPMVYNGTATAATIGQTDQDATNDVSSYVFEVTDTVMSRDNNTASGSLGLPGGNAGVLGQVFEIPMACYISSATLYLRQPNPGDSISVDLYTYGGLPDAIIASTVVYIVQAADTDGVLLTIPFSSGPFTVSPGIYFLGVNQYATDSNITLGTSTYNYRPESAYFLFEGGTWTPVEQNAGGPIIVCYILRLNMQDLSISVNEIGDRKFQVYPNPTSSSLNIKSMDANGEFSVELYDMVGNKIMEMDAIAAREISLDVSGVAPGMYLLKTTAGGNSSSVRVAVN
jgi:hypothetical protein